jgi:hypothetical protein
LRNVGEELGKQLASTASLARARSLGEALECVARVARPSVFEARVLEHDRHQTVLSVSRCPLRRLVRVQPEAAELDRGVWASLLARPLAGARTPKIACSTECCLDSRGPCIVRLSLE